MEWFSTAQYPGLAQGYTQEIPVSFATDINNLIDALQESLRHSQSNRNAMDLSVFGLSTLMPLTKSNAGFESTLLTEQNDCTGC
jgi:hypothetical protein